MSEESVVSFEQAVAIVSAELKNKLLKIPHEVKEETFDIRLRAGKPLILVTKNRKYFMDKDGKCNEFKNGNEYICTCEIINDTFNRLCSYSVHSYLNQLVKGYITIKGGHRVAVAGTAVMKSDREITAVKNISSISIRVAREKIGCCGKLPDFIAEKGYVDSFIIAGPPCSGKTTLLRDVARHFSDRQFNVCIVDERQEIACVNNGVSEMNLGDNVDVLDGYDKRNGIDIGVRTLSPDIIVVDEVSTSAEIDAIRSGVNSGVKFIVTVHASDFNEIINRRQICELLSTYSFEKLVLLNKAGCYEIYETQVLRDEIIRRRINMVESDNDRVLHSEPA